MLSVFTLQRDAFQPDHTYGKLYSPNGEFLCDTLERPWLDNQYGVSCIPEGSYPVAPYDSPSKGDVWLLGNTQPRSMIEIHPSNFVRQLEGCIAVGIRGKIGADYAVLNSKDTFATLKETLPDSFILKIINSKG